MNEQKENKLLFCGDIHGNFDFIVKNICKNYVNSNINFIGDIGLGFQPLENDIKRLQLLNEVLNAKNNKAYLIRGNHDDPRFFNQNVYKQNYSNIKLLEDYSILNINGKNILYIGGGFSLDFKTRISYHQLRENNPNNWWKDEMPVFDENKICQIESKIDIICTHVPPDFLFPEDKLKLYGYKNPSPDQISGCKKEREVMTSIYNTLLEVNKKPAYWYYGHFHHSYYEEYNDIKFSALNIEEIVEYV